MLKIEAPTLEEAYEAAAKKLRCSVTALDIEIVQQPNKGVFGFMKKNAIIIAAKKHATKKAPEPEYEEEIYEDEEEDEAYDFTQEIEEYQRKKAKPKTKKVKEQPKRQSTPKVTPKKAEPKKVQRTKAKKSILIEEDEVVEVKQTPKRRETKKTEQKKHFHKKAHKPVVETFVEEQEEFHEEEEISRDIETIAAEIEEQVNELFDLSCFEIDYIEVTPYDENTVLVNFQGEDAALLIGKEGYRYKAISYMIFNWINAEYGVQLVLEIAEFLKNQEEAIDAYLVEVYDTIENEGRAQTKILDGVLIQIALQKLRETYPEKYIVVRSTRDGLKYIIINDYYAH